VVGRKKIEGLFSTGQIPHWAVVPTEEDEKEEEEEEEEEDCLPILISMNTLLLCRKFLRIVSRECHLMFMIDTFNFF